MTGWSPDRHEAAKRACEQATGGEWIAVSLGTEKGRADAKGRSPICSVLRQEGVVTTAQGGQFPSSDMRFIAIARTDLPDALAEIERLNGIAGEAVIKLAEEENAHAQSLNDRDAFEARIDEIADALGDDTEWSSANDRGVNALEIAREAVERLAAIRVAVDPVRHWFDGDGEGDGAPTPDVQIVRDAVEELQADREDNLRLRRMLNSIVASTTDPAIKAMALRALEGAER